MTLRKKHSKNAINKCTRGLSQARHKLKGYGVTLQPATLLLMNSAATTALARPISFGLQDRKQKQIHYAKT